MPISVLGILVKATVVVEEVNVPSHFPWLKIIEITCNLKVARNFNIS